MGMGINDLDVSEKRRGLLAADGLRTGDEIPQSQRQATAARVA
jgi:hypothetical protein